MKMTRRVALYAVVACMLISSRCYGGLEDAHTIYQQRLRNASAGIHAVNDLLFAIVEIPDVTGLSSGRIQAKCLLHSVALLREFASGQPTKGCEVRTNALLQRYPLLSEECRKARPTFERPDFQFRLPSRVLENQMVGGVWRYVVALPRKEFDSQVSLLWQETCSLQTTIMCLKQRVESLQIAGNDEDLIAFWLRLGAMEEAVDAANSATCRRYPLASYAISPLDTLDLYTAWDSANDKLTANDVAEGDVRIILRQIPGFPPALRWIAEKSVASKHPIPALNLDLMVLVDGTEHRQDCERLLGLLEKCSRDSQPGGVEKEYRELVKSLLNTKTPTLLFQDGTVAKVVERVWRTQGHVNFPGSAADHATKQIKTAERESDNLQEKSSPVLKMVLESVRNDPGSGTSWKGVGHILMDSKMYLAAIPFLVQATRQDRGDADARMKLAVCYQKMDYTQLCHGAAFAALIALKNPESDRNRFQTCLDLLDVVIKESRSTGQKASPGNPEPSRKESTKEIMAVPRAVKR